MSIGFKIEDKDHYCHLIVKLKDPRMPVLKKLERLLGTAALVSTISQTIQMPIIGHFEHDNDKLRTVGLDWSSLKSSKRKFSDPKYNIAFRRVDYRDLGIAEYRNFNNPVSKWLY